MARRRKKQTSEESGGTWMTTFSDLMSLLLTFFILLFSMSSVSEDKFQAASQSMNVAFSGGKGTSILDKSALVNTDTSSESQSEQPGESEGDSIPPEVAAMYEKIVDYMEKENLDTQVEVSRDQDGIYMEMQESILFATGYAEVTETGKETLDAMAEMLNMFDQDIIVEGYTDDVPMRGRQFSSNWELSTGRAVAVLRYLSEEKNVAPSRLSAKGYGEYNPIVPNDSAENRAKNRRVNVVLVYDENEEE